MSVDGLALAVAKLVDAANGHHGAEPGQHLRDAINDLASFDGPYGEEVRSRVGTALAGVTSPSGAGLNALWLGAGVEHDAAALPQVRPRTDAPNAGLW
jgi:hypothetical protein